MNKGIEPRKGILDRYKLYLTILALLVAAMACDLPEGLGGSEEGGGTGSSETMIAGTLTARAEGADLPSTETPPPTSDTNLDTATVIPTLTPTETLTPTPESAQVSVTGDTFCRTGPGSVYDQVSILNVDESTEILAKDPTGNFWFVVNPDDPSQKCWVWGKYATPDGSTSGMPVFTPPPTPTPGLAFSVDFHRGDVHTGQMHLWFVIENTGGVDLESVTTTVKSKYQDAAGSVFNQTSTSTYNAFHDSGLSVSPTYGKATPGQTVYTVSGEQRTIHGNAASVTMKICSKDNLNGICVTRNFNITLY